MTARGHRWLLAAVAFGVVEPARAQALGPEVRPFVAIEAPAFVLQHVRVIDGTGAAAREDQSVVVVGGRVQAVGPAQTAKIPDGARVLDLPGCTVLPGLVG
ncbi:MAG TPA: hypothetical protein VGF41_13405, partial [Myxococcaceae bacterium]